MDRAKIVEFLRKNWKWIIMLLFAGGTGYQVGILKIQKGDKLEIYVIIPEEWPDVFGSQPQAIEARGQFSTHGLLALRMAGIRLKEDNSDSGRKLFVVLKALHNDPTKLGAAEQGAKAAQLDPFVISIIAKIAIKVAIAYLERRAPRTDSEWDDRLLALLKLFEINPSSIDGAYKAIQ